MTLRALPPGCSFFPSQMLLLSYYLTHKNMGSLEFGHQVIKEIDLYSHEPFDLPHEMSFSYGVRGRKTHWYCYVTRKGGSRRVAASGIWISKGRSKDVYGCPRNMVIGKRRRFVFYLGDSKTDWVLDEFDLPHHSKDSFVLCRVFVKSSSGKNAPDYVLSSYAEESVAIVKHIGIKYDESIARENDNAFDDVKSEILKFPIEQSIHLKNPSISASPIGDSQNSLAVLANVPFSSMGDGFVDGIGGIGALSFQDSTFSFEDNFVELDDLLFPCWSVD